MSESKREWEEGTYRPARERAPERDAACRVDAITSDYPDRVRRWLPKGLS